LSTRYGSNPDVTLVSSALGAKAGKRYLHRSGIGTSISTLAPEHYWRGDGPWPNQLLSSRYEVGVTTLDALIATYGCPAFVKIDVEGYEYQVLQGLSQFVPLSFEFHPCFHVEARRCMERLQELEPPVRFNHTVDEQLSFASDRWLELEEMCDTMDALFEEHGTVYFGNIYAQRGEE